MSACLCETTKVKERVLYNFLKEGNGKLQLSEPNRMFFMYYFLAVPTICWIFITNNGWILSVELPVNADAGQ